MSTKYKTVITTAGAAKLAAATVPGGKKVNITAMAVGDGGGTLPEPNASQTKLINEVWRHALNKISQDNKKKNYIVAELVIPPEVGGFWMRELGLYDDAGTLIAVANMAESYKPKLEEGSGRAQTCRMVIIVSSIESVELTIDSTTVMATQEYVDDKLAEHEQSRRHPDATLKEKGFTQLSSATDSSSETLAATPKAVKAAYDIATAKYTAVDATTAKKGIVQLSSATDSASEVLAATPKAVKAANDNANSRIKTDALTTSREDTVAGHVLQVGDYGLGVANGTTRYLSSIYDIKCAGFYNALGSGADNPTTGIPDNSGNTRFGVSAVNIYSNQYLVTLTSNVHFYVGLVKTAEKIAVWSKFYNTLNKPNAGDVGALPISGGQMLGAIRGSADGAGSYASQNNANVLAPFFQQINDAATSKFFPIIKQRYAQGNGTWSLGTIISAGNFQLHYVSQSDPAGKAFTFTKDGQFMPGSYANFDARYQAKGNYTPAGQAYTKAESDGRFQPKGSYTPAGQAYTKAESDARFVRDVRLGAQVLVSASANGSYASLTAPSGHQLTAILDRDTSRWPMPDSPDSAYARPVQKFINNQWVTVSQL